jgi:FdrA protein
MSTQIQQLENAGALVETSNEAAIRYTGQLLRTLSPKPDIPYAASGIHSPQPVSLAMLNEPLAAINVGLETFSQSLIGQGAPVIQLDWQPPAGGNERLMAILQRMRQE